MSQEDGAAVSQPFVNTVACPRCGCWAARNFKCGCGEVHFDHCENCGRGTHLAPDAHTELGALGPFVKNPCEEGQVLHTHRKGSP